MNTPEIPRRRSYLQKIIAALHGWWLGVRGQSSFAVHAVCAVAVIAVAAWLRVERVEACLLALCIAAVLAAEMFNSALESLAKAIDKNYNIHVAEGLDIASGAVLLTAVGASVVGVLVLGYRAAVLFQIF
jgi:diacylglycerol kinase (ATP)